MYVQGHHAAKEIAKYAISEEVSHYHTACNEFLHRVIMKDCSKKAGKHINRETVIFDCTGMGWHRMSFLLSICIRVKIAIILLLLLLLLLL